MWMIIKLFLLCLVYILVPVLLILVVMSGYMFLLGTLAGYPKAALGWFLGVGIYVLKYIIMTAIISTVIGAFFLKKTPVFVSAMIGTFSTIFLLVILFLVFAKNPYGGKRIIADSHSSEQEKIKQLSKEWFLKRDINGQIEVHSWEYTTMLHMAIKNEEVELVKFLLEHGADVNIKPKGSDGALMTAMSECRSDKRKAIIKLLIEHGADVNVKRGFGGATPLRLAQDVDELKMVLGAGADVYETNDSGETPLQDVLGSKRTEEHARLIYAAGGRLGTLSPDEPEKKIEAMMDYACSDGFTRVVEQLLEFGVKPTPHYAIMAAQEGQTEVLKQLVAAGLDINQPDKDGSYPFLSAVGLGHLDTVRFFVEHGADLKAEEKLEEGGSVGPALVLAALNGHLAIVKYLIEQKADVNKANKSKNTALQVASWNNHVDVVKELLKAGANPNLPDADNDTPLTMAAFAGHVEVARLLLKAGAEVNVKNKEGKSPLMLAQEEGHTSLVELLKAAGAKQ